MNDWHADCLQTQQQTNRLTDLMIALSNATSLIASLPSIVLLLLLLDECFIKLL